RLSAEECMHDTQAVVGFAEVATVDNNARPRTQGSQQHFPILVESRVLAGQRLLLQFDETIGAGKSLDPVATQVPLGQREAPTYRRPQTMLGGVSNNANLREWHRLVSPPRQPTPVGRQSADHLGQRPYVDNGVTRPPLLVEDPGRAPIFVTRE